MCTQITFSSNFKTLVEICMLFKTDPLCTLKQLKLEQAISHASEHFHSADTSFPMMPHPSWLPTWDVLTAGHRTTDIHHNLF